MRKIQTLIGSTLLLAMNLYAEPSIELKRIQEAYPDTIQAVSTDYILWKNGNRISIRSSFIDRLASVFSRQGKVTSDTSISVKDLRCDSYEPFFKKMYGSTEAEVKKKLVIVYWMPHVFGKQYPLKVTTVNGVNKKIERISAELEKLPMSYRKYLVNPGGSFYWRNVKSEKYLSAHSFGIAIDINSHYGNYWLWDWQRGKQRGKYLTYHNNIPMRIVEIFEQEGFLWGGRWYFYDTMHFEYRPELFAKSAGSGIHYNNELGLRCNA